MKERWSTLMEKDGAKTVVASLISIFIGLLVGCLIVLVVGLTNPALGAGSVWDGIRLVLGGILSTGRDSVGNLTFGFNPANVGNMLFRATPLILTGLSVAVAFKTGLFNIGAPGQYLMGTMATLVVALSIPTTSVPAPIVWLLAFLAGMLAGAVWGAIPGLVKALLNINEVLACIMTNWIAANLVTWVFDESIWRNMEENGKTGYIYKTTRNGVETVKWGLDAIFPGSQVNWGIIIAVVLAVVVYIFITKTTMGYELVSCGSNRHATLASTISGTLCCPWRSLEGCPVRRPHCTICLVIRSFSGLPTNPCLPLALTASRWPSWRPVTQSPSFLPAALCLC